MSYSLDTQPLINMSIPSYLLSSRFRLNFILNDFEPEELFFQATTYAMTLPLCIESVNYTNKNLYIKLRVPESISIDNIRGFFVHWVKFYNLEILTSQGQVIETLSFIQSSVEKDINFNISFDYSQTSPLYMEVIIPCWHMNASGHSKNV